jgi:hypothetical protein
LAVNGETPENHRTAQRSFWKRTITVGLITAAVPVFTVIFAECSASARMRDQISTSESGQSTRQSQQLNTSQAAEITRDWIRQGTEQAGYSTREAYQATQGRKQLDDVVSFTQTAEYKNTEVAKALNPFSPQPSITPHPTANPADPLQTIEMYFTFLNGGEYLAAWDLLHEQFKDNCCKNEFDTYKGFWSTAGIVSVVELMLENEVSQYNVYVLVRLYWDKDGYERSYRYNMVFSLEDSKWQIKSVGGV